MAFGSIRTVLVICATVSGVAMVTADDDTLALETMNETSKSVGLGEEKSNFQFYSYNI